MSEYFPGRGKVKVELDLSNYEIKRDFENATGVHTSTFAKKFDLTNLKSDVDKLDIGKLKNLQTNFNNLKSKIFVLSLHYNGSNSFLFVNATKVYQFKAKNSEIKDYALCLGNVSKDFTINKMKKNRIKRSCKTFFC